MFSEPEEGAQTLCVVANREPTAAACVPARDRPVDVGDNDRAQRRAPLVKPVEETIRRAAAAADRRLGPSAFPAHPLPEDRDLTDVGVPSPWSSLCRLFEQIRKTQPSHRATDESLTLYRLCRATRSAVGRRLDPGHADTLALTQIQKRIRVS